MFHAGGRSGTAVGVEVAADFLIATTVKRGAISSATMRRLPTTTPGDAIAVDARTGLGAALRPPLHLVICDPAFVHRTLVVPHMSDRERAEVVRRDIGRNGGGDRSPLPPGVDSERRQRDVGREDGSDRDAFWRLTRQVEIDGVRKDEILIMVGSPATVRQHIDPIIAGTAIPRLVVTGPLALIAAARALLTTPLDRPTVLVHWGLSALTIVIVSDGALKFARIIEPPAADLDPLGWIPVEIDRSIRRYGVLSKGERIEQAVVAVAKGEPARRLFTGAELGQRLRLPVTNLNALLAPVLPARGVAESGAADLDMTEGAFMLAYGAALLSPNDVPNLLPAALVVEVRSRKVLAGAVAATVLLAVAVGSASASKADQAVALRTRLTQARAAVQARQARAAADTAIEAERQRMRQLARLLTNDPLKHLPVDDALREIARLAPADLRLDRLTLSIEGAGYALRLAGRVESPDLADAQHTLSSFYYGLRSSPLFYDVHSPEIGGASSTPASAEPADAAAPALPFVLTLRPKDLE